MEIQWKPLLANVAIPLAVGGISGAISSSGMKDYATLAKPPLSPPGWVFPVVWTILYVLMGVASYLIYIRQVQGEQTQTRRNALIVYGIQLAFNFLWPIAFFNFKLYLFAFFWLLVMWVLIIVAVVLFARLSKAAAWLMAPYLVWVTFAAYLNLGTAILN